MILLICFILGVSGVYCDDHSLRGYQTVVSSPESGLHVYSGVVYVDDQLVADYTSDSRQYLPKVEWVKKLEAEYWEMETQRSRGNQYNFIHQLQTLMKRFNDTKGVHYYQWMFGCELRDDGSTAGYMQDGYDGRDYMYLDTQSGIWIPTMNEAQITAQLWNGPEIRLGQRNKYNLETTCMTYLKKLIDYGKKELEKRVRPEVKVWGRQSDGVLKLHCLVYGFHPRVIDVKWMRNGTHHIISIEANPILPHPDGTYQTRVTVEVPTEGRDSYSCHVDHSSLEEPLVFMWDPSAEEPKNKSTVIALVILGAVLSIAVAAAGYILYRRHSGIRSTY